MLRGKFRMTEIPYRGSAPAINDLLGGNIDLVPDYLLANKQNIDAGKLKFLATGGRERIKSYPKVATIAETLPGVFADTWMAVAAPPGTPKEITQRLSDAIGQGFKTDELRKRILSLEAEPLGNSPDDMRKMIEAQHAALGAGDRGGEGQHRLMPRRGCVRRRGDKDMHSNPNCWRARTVVCCSRPLPAWRR